MKDKTKNILIVFLLVLIVVLAVALAFMIASKREEMKDLSGEIIVAGENYVIISTDEEDFLINGVEDAYKVGDVIKITYREKDRDDSSNPKSITAKDSILKKSAEIEKIPIEDSKEDSLPPKTDPQNPPVDKESETSKNADEEVLEYVTNLESDFKNNSIKESLKSGFITVVDFIFYDGSIKGHTFKDLSDSAKLKVLSVALYFDDKIDTYFPGYKESISSTTGKIYNKAKEEILESYLNVTALVCEKNESLCATAKEGFGELKKNFGLTWSLIKDIAGDGASKLKTWYEIFSGK